VNDLNLVLPSSFAGRHRLKDLRTGFSIQNMSCNLSSATHIRSWLQEQNPKQLTLLDKLENDYLRRNSNVSKIARAPVQDRVLIILRFVEFFRKF